MMKIVFRDFINLLFFSDFFQVQHAEGRAGGPDHPLSGGVPVHRPHPAGDGDRKRCQRRGSTYVNDSDMRRRRGREDAERPGPPDYNDPEPDHWGM